MTNEEINKAIAESMGWMSIHRFGAGGEYVGTKNNKSNPTYLPNYCEDLNAMHKVEKTLTDSQGGDYEVFLWLLVRRDGTRPASWHISAKQKTEAYLKTKGLWKD